MKRVVRMNIRKEHPMRKLPGCHCNSDDMHREHEPHVTNAHDTENMSHIRIGHE
jgi:hypothetical protein